MFFHVWKQSKDGGLRYIDSGETSISSDDFTDIDNEQGTYQVSLYPGYHRQADEVFYTKSNPVNQLFGYIEPVQLKLNLAA